MTARILHSGWRSGKPSSAAALLCASVLLLVLVPGCGGTSDAVEEEDAVQYRYAPAAVLTDARLAARGGDLSALLPEGWKETSDERHAPSIVLWMVREDYGASLSFTPMAMNPALYDALKKDGLAAVARASIALRRSNARDSVRVVHEPELFDLRGRRFAAYEYSTDGGATVTRVVVLDTGRRFLECAMMPLSQTITPAEHRRLFETQQAVLASSVLP